MIKLRRYALLPALLKVSKVINGRGRNQVLKNIKMTCDANQLQLLATNGEQSVAASVACEADKSFTAIVYAKTLEQIIRKFDKYDTLDFEPCKGLIKIRSSRLCFNIATFPEDEYPETLDFDNCTCEFSTTKDIIDQLIKQVLFAAGTEETRVYLNGIHIHSAEDMNNQLVAVATDGMRLAKTTIKIKQVVNLAPVTVPTDFWKLIKTNFFDAKQPIKVSFNDTSIRMKQDGQEIISKLIDFNYPDYQRVFPTENNDYFRLNRQALINEINNVCAVFNNKKYMPLSVNFASGGVTLEAHNSDFGSALADVPVIASISTEDGVGTGFNGRFLLDILAATDAEEIVFRLDAKYPYGAAIIETHPSEQTIYLLMARRN